MSDLEDKFVSEDVKELLNKEDIDKAAKDAAKTLAEYRDFAFKGDLLKMASAFIVASALNTFITAVNGDVLMPFVNYVVLHAVGTWQSARWTPVEGLTFEIGKVINSTLDMFFITVILFFLIKWLGRLEGQATPPPVPEPQPIPVFVVRRPPKKKKKPVHHKLNEDTPS